MGSQINAAEDTAQFQTLSIPPSILCKASLQPQLEGYNSYRRHCGLAHLSHKKEYLPTTLIILTPQWGKLNSTNPYVHYNKEEKIKLNSTQEEGGSKSLFPLALRSQHQIVFESLCHSK